MRVIYFVTYRRLVLMVVVTLLHIETHYYLSRKYCGLTNGTTKNENGTTNNWNYKIKMELQVSDNGTTNNQNGTIKLIFQIDGKVHDELSNRV